MSDWDHTKKETKTQNSMCLWNTLSPAGSSTEKEVLDLRNKQLKYEHFKVQILQARFKFLDRQAGRQADRQKTLWFLSLNFRVIRNNFTWIKRLEKLKVEKQWAHFLHPLMLYYKDLFILGWLWQKLKGFNLLDWPVLNNVKKVSCLRKQLVVQWPWNLRIPAKFHTTLHPSTHPLPSANLSSPDHKDPAVVISFSGHVQQLKGFNDCPARSLATDVQPRF